MPMVPSLGQGFPFNGDNTANINNLTRTVVRVFGGYGQMKRPTITSKAMSAFIERVGQVVRLV